MVHSFVRVLRTPSSERFLLQNAEARDFAALDMHYLPSGQVNGTLVLYDDASVDEAEIPNLLHEIDEKLLPDVQLDDGNLSFVVVIGKILGNFDSQLNSA